MKGSLHKHVAKDGTATWRIRVEYYDDAGQRHQPQRTYATKREAEAALARWIVEIERERPAEVGYRARTARHRIAPSARDVAGGPATCLSQIARIASTLQWCRQDMSRQQVTRELRLIEEYAQAALAALRPEEEGARQARGSAPAEPHDGPYHVYRLLADGVPFYVGQSRDVPGRVHSHISAALGSRPGKSARTRVIREALANEKTITYDIVASAQSVREICVLEREWIMRTLAQGHMLANGAAL